MATPLASEANKDKSGSLTAILVAMVVLVVVLVCVCLGVCVCVGGIQLVHFIPF